jgi:dCTP deaminase
MLLADRHIREAVDAGVIGIEPWEPGNVQPASVDVRLDRHFKLMRPSNSAIDPCRDSAEAFNEAEIADGCCLYFAPGDFALASTFERITLPAHVVARVEGRSSLARLGLVTHATAGFIDPGFTGHVTFELSNVGTRPLLLWPGMRVAQLAFQTMTGAAEQPYGSDGLHSHYQGQRGPTLSRIHERFDHGLPPQEVAA